MARIQVGFMIAMICAFCIATPTTWADPQQDKILALFDKAEQLRGQARTLSREQTPAFKDRDELIGLLEQSKSLHKQFQKEYGREDIKFTRSRLAVKIMEGQLRHLKRDRNKPRNLAGNSKTSPAPKANSPRSAIERQAPVYRLPKGLMERIQALESNVQALQEENKKLKREIATLKKEMSLIKDDKKN